MQRWWTSDYHFDHDKMMTFYLGRPFKTTEEGNEAFIEWTNAVVKKGDVLTIAGDVTLHHNTELVYRKFINRLNGTKIILRGNHDYWMPKNKGKYLDHRKVEGAYIATSHYPMRSWNRSIHGSINLHGHTHGQMYPFRNQLDISIDNAFNILGEYRPFSLEEILAIIKNRKFNWWQRYALKYLYNLDRWIRKGKP